MHCPQSRPSTMSCRQTMAISKPSGGVAADGGVAAGIGATPRSASEQHVPAICCALHSAT